MDHFDKTINDENHCILDQKHLEMGKTLERLVRTS
jgi:hypothetical protein